MVDDEAILDDNSIPLDSKMTFLACEASDLLRQQEYLLGSLMSDVDMILYEERARQIGELLRQLTIDSGMSISS
jgi:hypothetical protein